MSIPRPVLDLASSQHNTITRRQASAHMSVHAYDGELRRGRLRRIHTGVAEVSGGARPPEQRLMAAALRAGDGARITGPAVLGLLHVDGFTTHAPFTVLLPRGRTLGPVDFATAEDPLPGIDVATVGGVPVAGLPLALLDAAAADPTDRRLRVAVDSACGRRLTTRRSLVDRSLQLGHGHAGAAWLLDLEGGGGLRADSEKEREVTAVLASVRPQPEVQAWLTDRIRPDYLWRDLRLVGEYLGWVDHDPSNTRDDARFNAIRALDHEIVTITAADLRDPDALVERIQLRLVRRARELGLPLS